MQPFMALSLLAATLPQAVVIHPVANMYGQATEDADVVSQAIYGSNIAVLEERAGWLRVRTADEYTGWMPSGSLRRLGSGEKTYASAGRVAQVESLFAHIYREPDVTKHGPVITVPFDTRLEVIAEPAGEERWLQVRLPDDPPAGCSGATYLWTPNLSPSRPPSRSAVAFWGCPILGAALPASGMIAPVSPR